MKRQKAILLFKKNFEKIRMEEYGRIEYSGIHKFFYEDTVHKYSLHIEYQKNGSSDSCEYVISEIALQQKNIYTQSKMYEIHGADKNVYIFDRPWKGIYNNPGDDFFFRLAINQNDNRFYIDSSSELFIKDTLLNRKHFVEVKTITSNFAKVASEQTEVRKFFYFNKQSGILERFIQYTIVPADTEYSEFILDDMYKGPKEKSFSKKLSDTLSYYLQNYTSVEEKTLIERSKSVKLLAKGASCPPVEIRTLHEGIINTQDIRDKILLLDFWFSTCGPCQLAIPKLNDLYNKYKDRGIVIIGLTPFDNEKSLTRQLKKKPASFPVGIINKITATDSFGVKGYPTLFIFDKNKKLIATESGYSSDYQAKIEEVINSLLNP